jgi:polysaccharide export outer membrane protein
MRTLLVPMLVAAALGCAGPSKPPPTAAAVGQTAPYEIGVPDVLRVTVWKHPDLTVEAPVRNDGKISVPLLNDVQAAGQTPEGLAQAIAKGLSAFVSQPDVTVIVISPDSKVVTVVGGVTTSGVIPLRGRMDVIEAVAAAGGFSAWANKNGIRVIRTVYGERTSYRFDYKGYLEGEAGAEFWLEPGDVVVVPE